MFVGPGSPEETKVTPKDEKVSSMGVPGCPASHPKSKSSLTRGSRRADVVPKPLAWSILALNSTTSGPLFDLNFAPPELFLNALGATLAHALSRSGHGGRLRHDCKLE